MTANDSVERTEDRSLNNHAALKTSIANGRLSYRSRSFEWQ